MIASPTTSLTLLDRLGGGDDPSWRRMFHLYAPLLRAWLRSRGLQPADIDDLTQNALAVVHRRLSEFHHNGRPGAFRTWLRGIVANVVRDHLRTAGRKPLGDGQLAADLEDPHSELSRQWDADHDRFILRGLMQFVEPEFAPATWTGFVETALHGRASADVAAELGLSVNAVHVARSRVLARLRREAEGFVDPF